MSRTASKALRKCIELQVLTMLLLLPIAALAQAIPTTTAVPQELKSQQLTAEDTIRAVHNLFESRRSGGIVLTGSAIVGDLVAAQLATESEKNQNSFLRFGFGFHAMIFGIIAAPLATVGIRKIVSYRGGRERRVINEFRTTHWLPYSIQRRLQSKFFAQPKPRRS